MLVQVLRVYGTCWYNSKQKEEKKKKTLTFWFKMAKELKDERYC